MISFSLQIYHQAIECIFSFVNFKFVRHLYFVNMKRTSFELPHQIFEYNFVEAQISVSSKFNFPEPKF